MLSDSNSDAVPEVSKIVSYRYVESNGSAALMRFALDDASSSAESSSTTTMSTRLPPPPSDWADRDPVTHAGMITSIEEPSVGSQRMLEISFAGGTRTRVSARHRELATPSTTTAPVVDRPNVRCGGSITIVLNTSSTSWTQGAASTITGDLSGFVQSLKGTPTHIRFVGFDRSAYSLFPETPIGSYVELLNSSTLLTALHSRLAALSSTATSWRNGRNWEDGLWQATRRDTGTLFSQLPDLVVFLTDGSPNRNRTNTSSDTDTTFHAADLSRASAAADQARNIGTMMIGVMLGAHADATASGHLDSVFGSLVWDGGTNLTPLDRARTFTRPPAEGFARLDEIFGLIAQWRCAGTLTLQQRTLSGGVSSPPTDTWSFEVSTDDSTAVVNAIVGPRNPSTTIDFGADERSRSTDFTLVLQQLPRFRHHSASCTAAGQPLTTQVTSNDADTAVLRFSAPPRTALSCTLTSEAI